MSIESIRGKITNISDGGRNTAAEMRALLTEMTDQFSATTAFSGTTDNVPEGGTNLYYTDSRVDDKLLGYSLTGHTHSVSGITDFPTNISYFTNDVGYISGATNTADFNAHTGDTTIHFTQNDISITESQISDLGDYSLTGHTHTVSDITDFTDNSSNWDNAYNNVITGMTITGTIVKTVTLTQRDGNTITANFNDSTGGGGTGESITGATFNTSTGDLDFITNSGSTITTNIDGRYSLTGHTHISSDITDFSNAVSGNSAVILNTAKTGITETQASDIITNNAKTGITETQASDIILNNAKTGITETQAANIITNNAKVSYTDATLVANTVSSLNSHTGDTSIHFTKSSINLSELGSTAHTHTISNITDFPTNVSTFTNDVGYLTGATLNLQNVLDEGSTASLAFGDELSIGTSGYGFLSFTQVSGITMQGQGKGIFLDGGALGVNMKGEGVYINSPKFTAPSVEIIHISGDTTGKAVITKEYLVNQISGLTANTLTLNAHTGDTSIHFTKSSINLSDLGSSAHTHTISDITDFTDNSSQWNTSYDDSITGITVTGAGTKTITLQQRDGSVITTNFTDNAGSGGGTGESITGSSFNTSTGILSLTTNSGSTIVTSLDGRYLTSVPSATATVSGLTKLFSNTVQSVAANAVSTTASRTYGLQVNSSGQLVVNVPWVDTNTTYTEISDVNLSNTSSTTTGLISGRRINTWANSRNLTTGNTANWSSAYNDVITGMTVTGTDTKTITLTQRDGGTITANFSASTSGSSGGGGLEPLNEGNGIGWRLSGRTDANYGNIGLNAVDISVSTTTSGINGATGQNSFASGQNNVANSNNSAVFGSGNSAQRAESFVTGISNVCAGSYSAILGGSSVTIQSNANGSGLLGGSNNSVGNVFSAIIGGNQNIINSNGGSSVILAGESNTINSSTIRGIILGGISNTVSGTNALAQGEGNTSKSHVESVFGSFSTDYTPTNVGSWFGTDRVFNVGNGPNDASRSDAFTILKDGSILAPSLTATLINAVGDTSLITKKYADDNYSGGGGVSESVTGSTFNTSTGDLTLTTNSGTTIVTSLDGRYSLTGHTHTISDITDFPTNISSFTNDVGYITGFTDTNNNDYVSSAGFNTTNGVLTLTRLSGGTVTVDLDNRYSLTGHTHTASEITDFDTEVSNNADVLANNAKTGITETQAANIITNNTKTGITETQAANIITNNAKVSYTDGSLVSGISAGLASHTGDTSIHFTKDSINLSDLGSSAHTHTVSEISDFPTALVDSFVSSGGETQWVLSSTPSDSYPEQLYNNGAFLVKGVDWGRIGDTISFSGDSAPLSGEVISYYGNITSSPVFTGSSLSLTDLVTKDSLYTLTVTPLIEGTVVPDGFWGTGGTLGSNGVYNAFDTSISVVAGEKILVTGLVPATLPGGLNYGRLIDASGSVIGSSLATTNYSAALGGWVLTVPNTAGVTGVLLNFPDTALAGATSGVTVYRGEELVYESDLLIDSTLLDTNDKVGVVSNSYFNYNTLWVDTYFYGASGLPQSSGSNSALRNSIPVTEGQSIIFKGITFVGAQNYFRVFNSSGTFLSSMSSDDLKDIAYGKKLTINVVGAAYIKLWLPTTEVSVDNEIYVAESFLIVNQIKDTSLQNKQALAVANSGYFERGLNGEATTPTNICLEIIGQSQFDGRIPITDYPVWYTAATNTLVGAKICDDGSGVFADYDDTQQKTISSSQRFGLDLYLYKKIYDNVLTDSYYIKTTLGGTSLHYNGEGPGRWTPDFTEIGGLRYLSQEQRDAYIAASTGASSAFTTNVSAIIFMQGESDRNYPEFYYETMLKKIAYDRGVKNNPELPYILCGVSPDSVQYSYDVELQKQQIANSLRNVYYVAAPTGLANLQGDELHFNAIGGELFAEDIYQQLITIGVI